MKKRSWQAAVAAGILALAGCGDDGHAYPAEIETNFLKACTASGAESAHCACIFDALRKDYTAEEYMAAETALAAGQPSDAFMSSIAGAKARCMATD